MIYIRIQFLSCIFVMSLLSTVYGQPISNLRQQLESLLRDPEYNDDINEVRVEHKPRQIQGMLLKGLREHGLFDTSSEERFFNRLKTLGKASEASGLSQEKMSTTTMTSTSTGTTTIPPKLEPARTATTLGQTSSSVMGSFDSLSSIISKFIDMWTKSL